MNASRGRGPGSASKERDGTENALARTCDCEACAVLDLVSRPWSTALLRLLFTDGPLWFNELKRRLDGISARTLSDRLDAMTELGLVDRVEQGELSGRVDYQLTERGAHLRSVFISLDYWASRCGVDMHDWP